MIEEGEHKENMGTFTLMLVYLYIQQIAILNFNEYRNFDASGNALKHFQNKNKSRKCQQKKKLSGLGMECESLWRLPTVR